jgi:hypothetical protein
MAQALRGRDGEQAVLDRLLDEVRAGDCRVLVLRGEAGVGKTVLLDYVQERAPDCRVVRAAGVESEMELAFAVLHQLCAPLLNSLERLPDPQSDALSTAFGLGAGTAPDRYTVGLAVLGLRLAGPRSRRARRPARAAGLPRWRSRVCRRVRGWLPSGTRTRR